jgi:hypothetical protein
MSKKLDQIQKQKSWGSKNKWFGSDSAMTYTAFDIHKKLVDDEDMILKRTNIMRKLIKE